MTVARTASLKELRDSESHRELLSKHLFSQGLAVTKSGLEPKALQLLRREIRGRLKAAEPGWQPLDFGSDDYWWINHNDQRSRVKGAFLQVNFFPWNASGARVLDTLRPIFEVRNLLLGASPSAYLDPQPGDDFSARVAAQFYPSGVGWMQEHVDPKGNHQSVLASVVMSRKSIDYDHGGVYVVGESGERFFPEDSLDPGDVLWFAPAAPHGVDLVDPCSEPAPDPFRKGRGRWTVLCATNSLASGNTQALSRPVAEP